ncbi:uncharacterized protein [Dermacentor andersoni]|uniref:uncharacterized protein n=1 Tax=Dermacentor andersoni TaxID=34620 RepID=UPI002155E87B|nr:uncharacterized protein LOC126530015 [Dermacentor andersoni]XP_050033472.1 uncharacterized protein LOC126530054 [Dermacentor andersoni]
MPPTGASRRCWTAVCCRTQEYTCSPALRRTRQWWALVVATASMLLLAPLPQQPATAAGLPLPTEPLSTSWLARTRRDENEGIENRHRTANVGFYIGDPCNQTCSRVLYHVFCNVTSRRCECRPEYPVNIDNRQCVKASSLGGHCDHDEACAFSVTHSSCQSNECRCLDGHEPDAHATKCTPTRGVAILESAELTTMVSVIVALMVFTALFCLVLRLFSKARFGTSGRDRMGDAASPPPGPAVLSSVDGSLAQAPGIKGGGPGSRRTSRNSVDYAASRRASCGMLAPPADSQSCSRRASGSSVRSQTSQRSAASNRSGSLSRVGSRQTPAAVKGAEGSAATAAAAAAPTEVSGIGDEDERVPPAPPPATVGGQQRKPPHEPARGSASSPMDAARADPAAEQPITRPLRSPLSHDVRDKEVTGYATAPSFE